jgi:hypothetical protein
MVGVNNIGENRVTTFSISSWRIPFMFLCINMDLFNLYIISPYIYHHILVPCTYHHIQQWLLVYFPYFQKTKVGFMLSPFRLWVCESSPISYWMPEPVFMNLGMHIMAPDPISTAYFIHLCVCVCIPPIVARQRLGILYPFFIVSQLFGKHVSAATNTRNNRRIIFDACVCGSVCVSPFCSYVETQ